MSLECVRVNHKSISTFQDTRNVAIRSAKDEYPSRMLNLHLIRCARCLLFTENGNMEK